MISPGKSYSATNSTRATDKTDTLKLKKCSRSLLVYKLPKQDSFVVNLSSLHCNYNEFLAISEEEEKNRRNLKKLANFFQVAIHFHPSHMQTKMNNTTLFALAGLFLTKLNHYLTFPSIQICWGVFRYSK